jgi:magnesium transporter
MASTSRRRRNRSQIRQAKEGLPPGTPIYAGEPRDFPVTVQVIDYDAEHHVERIETNVADLCTYRDRPTSVTWINLDGIHDAAAVAAIGETFGLHSLWIEDILNPTSRPKVEILEDRVLLIARMVEEMADGNLEYEQVSLVLGPGFVLTFQERPGDVWDALRKRIATLGGRVRRMGADYLLHALLDATVDHYFVVLERLESQVDVLETRAIESPETSLPVQFQALKSELQSLRSVVWPTREAISTLVRGETAIIAPATMPFYRDLYDHVVQVMDIVDATRDRLVWVVELHLALTSQRMNEIMKVLTLVSTVFIPLSFIAGVFGMNFDVMPELHEEWGYPAVLTLMATIGFGLLLWFRAQKWL